MYKILGQFIVYFSNYANYIERTGVGKFRQKTLYNGHKRKVS